MISFNLKTCYKVAPICVSSADKEPWNRDGGMRLKSQSWPLSSRGRPGAVPAVVCALRILGRDAGEEPRSRVTTPQGSVLTPTLPGQQNDGI